MNDKVFTTLTLTSVVVFLCVVSYALWLVGKKVNYNFQYKDMVTETIQEKVKQECLK